MDEAYSKLVVTLDGAGPADLAGPAPEPDGPPLSTVTLAALEALIDLAAADGIEVRLEHPATRADGWPATWSLPSAWVRTVGGSGTGIDAYLDESDADQAARAVDAAQEAIFESMPARGRPTNWPACPEHPEAHPLQVVAGSAADPRPRWACPRTGVVIGTPLRSIME